jgi:hypothetical protein
MDGRIMNLHVRHLWIAFIVAAVLLLAATIAIGLRAAGSF